MKIDNRKTFIKRLLSGTMSKEQRKIFIQLDEIDFQLRKQWDEAGNESIDWQMKEQIWRNIKNKQDNKNRRFFQMFPKWQMIAATVTLLLITSAGLWFAKQQAGCVNDFIEVTAQESVFATDRTDCNHCQTVRKYGCRKEVVCDMPRHFSRTEKSG